MLSPLLPTRIAAYPPRTSLPVLSASAEEGDTVRFGAKKKTDGDKLTDKAPSQKKKAAPKPTSQAAAEPVKSSVEPKKPATAKKTTSAKAAEPVSPTPEPAKPETPKQPNPPEAPQGWTLFGMAKAAALFAVGSVALPVFIAMAPLSWTLGAGVAMSIALPILASRVNPQFVDGKLVNKPKVIQAAGQELKRLLKVVALPVKMVPNFFIKVVTLPFQLPLLNRIGVPTSRTGIYKWFVHGKKFLANNIPMMFENPRLQTFATGFPKTGWGKFKFGATCVGLLALVTLESRLAKLKWIGAPLLWMLRWFVPKDMVTNVKSFATEIGKSTTA